MEISAATEQIKNPHHYFKPEEDQIIRDNYGELSATLIAELLGPAFTKNSVAARVRRLGLRNEFSRAQPTRIKREHISPWAGESDRVLLEHWGKSSAALIAGLIGNDCTRSAVIARARRLGLPRIGPTWRDKLKESRPAPSRRGVRLKPRVPNAPPIIDQLIPFEQRKTLLQLGPLDCRWPVGHVGEPGFFFCGAQKFGKHSYCAAHYHRAHLGRA